MSTKEEQIDYIKNHLIKKIVNNLKNQVLVSSNIETTRGVDGFMSAIYRAQIITKDSKKNDEQQKHHIIIKFMKGNEMFRKTSKSYVQFANEIFIYSKVLPYYDEFISKSKSSIKAKEWIPHVYFAEYGKIEGLENKNSSPESVLALEDLKPKGYRCGPRKCLNREHLLLMMKPIAEYHSLTYAMRIKNDKNLDIFINEIIPLPWATKINEKNEMNLYYSIYVVAFERFLLYFDKIKNSLINDKQKNNDKLIKNIEKLRKYEKNPTKLLERYREIDNIFSVILHGDYNRNNVLFKYDNEDTYDNPKDIKMIDFQELRYGTPSIDLTFFMYINTDPLIRDDIWMELLHYYHNTMLNSLADILQIPIDDEKLKPYCFAKFYEHLSKFGFYGAIVCMHFLPWMYCSEEECTKLSDAFEEDMNSEEFRRLSIEVGGDYVNEIIFNIVKHASEMGYMDMI